MIARRWRVRLGAAAELDFANILQWTKENLGARQSRLYRDTIMQAIGELANGPDVAGSKSREEIMPGARTLHVARPGRRGSHFLLYQAVQGRGYRNRPDPARQDGCTAPPAISHQPG